MLQQQCAIFRMRDEKYADPCHQYCYFPIQSCARCKTSYCDDDIISVKEIPVVTWASKHRPWWYNEGYPPPCDTVKVIKIKGNNSVSITGQHYFDEYMENDVVTFSIYGNLTCPICADFQTSVSYTFSATKLQNECNIPRKKKTRRNVRW